MGFKGQNYGFLSLLGLPSRTSSNHRHPEAFLIREWWMARGEGEAPSHDWLRPHALLEACPLALSAPKQAARHVKHKTVFMFFSQAAHPDFLDRGTFRSLLPSPSTHFFPSPAGRCSTAWQTLIPTTGRGSENN